MKALLVRLLFGIFALLPLRAAHALGAGIGALFGIIPNRRRRTSETNIRLCFPELTGAEQRALARASLIEFAKGFAELGTLWTRDAEELRRLVRDTRGEDAVRAAIAAGKGVIIAAPHHGAWELVGLYCSLLGPMNSMFRTPPMSALGNAMRRARERFGARLVPADASGVRALMKALARGEMIGILPDQVPGDMSGAVFASFFDQPAATMVLLSRLAAKSGAPVFFTFAERLANGQGYRLHFRPGPPAVASADAATAAAAVNEMVEQCVRVAPAQYQWVYKRFRVRPPGEAPVY
jgi:KDO2-lipid IV(A) lauroyltransferase